MQCCCFFLEAGKGKELILHFQKGNATCQHVDVSYRTLRWYIYVALFVIAATGNRCRLQTSSVGMGITRPQLMVFIIQGDIYISKSLYLHI